MSDVGAALTDSLDRFGRGSMLAPIKAPDGVFNAPVYSFSSEATLGVYRDSPGVLGFVMAGTIALLLSATTATFATTVAPTWASDPTGPNALTRKSYVDGAISTAGFLPLTGGALAGPGNLDIAGKLSVGGPFPATAPNARSYFRADAATGIAIAVFAETFGAGGIFQSRAIGGTPAAPTATPINTNLLALVGAGTYDGTNFHASTSMNFQVEAVPTVSSQPSRISFQTTPAGSVTRREVTFIDSAGNVMIGAGVPITQPYQLQVYGLGKAGGTIFDADPRGGALMLQDTSNASGSGGMVTFGSGFSPKPVAYIKSNTLDASGNQRGDLLFGTRTTIGDTAMTEKMRLLSVGQLLVGATSGGLGGIGIDVNGFVRATGPIAFQSAVSGVTIGSSAGLAEQIWTTASAPANQKIWDVFVDASGTMIWRALRDDVTNATAWLTIPRTGFAASYLNWGAPFGFNGAPGFGHTIDMQNAVSANAGGSIGGVSNIGGYSDAGAYTIWAGRNVSNGAYVQLFGGSNGNPSLLILGNSVVGGNLSINAAGEVNLPRGTGLLRIGGAITKFESAEITPPTTSVVTTIAHGGPRAPDLVQLYLRCKIAEQGFSVGDEFLVPPCDIGDPTRQVSLTTNATNIFFANVTSGAAQMGLRANRGLNPYVAITNANWRIVARAHWL
jgi:hypothetical protein